LEKALRRQSGAEDVALDTRASWATLVLAPAPIDFPQMVKDVAGAGYTTTKIRVTGEGRVVKDQCPQCKKEAEFLELLPTKQRLELVGGELGPGGAFVGEMQGWTSDHPQIQLLAESPDPAAPADPAPTADPPATADPAPPADPPK
jgi:hypothetical protein